MIRRFVVLAILRTLALWALILIIFNVFIPAYVVSLREEALLLAVIGALLRSLDDL